MRCSLWVLRPSVAWLPFALLCVSTRQLSTSDCPSFRLRKRVCARGSAALVSIVLTKVCRP